MTEVLSIIVPLLNEQESLPLLLSRLLPIARSVDPAYELILIDDGSTDNTPQMLADAAREYPSIRVIRFSRNFGHQAAITAGLDFSTGDCVIMLDADLQDPPELIPRMVELFLEGYDVVSPQRQSRPGDSWFKRKTAAGFYWLLQRLVDRRISPEVGDFRLLSRRAVRAISTFEEHHRFMRGLVAWLGLREAFVPFTREARQAGSTKYSLLKMLRFAWTAITSFSGLPLRVASLLGCCFVLLDIVLIAYILYVTLVLHTVVPGWASLILVQALFSGVTLISIGLVGDYISRIFEQAKQRPLYVVDQTCNLSPRGTGHRGLLLEPPAVRSHTSNQF